MSFTPINHGLTSRDCSRRECFCPLMSDYQDAKACVLRNDLRNGLKHGRDSPETKNSEIPLFPGVSELFVLARPKRFELLTF
jgi:hypothetical protein